MSTYDDFIQTLEAVWHKDIAKRYSDIGNYDYSNCTFDELIQIISQIHPKIHPDSQRHIMSICKLYQLYAIYIGNIELYKMINANNIKDKLSLIPDKNAKNKYISFDDFESLCKDISLYEFGNQLYKETLLRCVYEGIYSKDMSVFKNLRASDINGNTITLREDNGDSYNMTVSSRLAEDLIELSTENVWERLGVKDSVKKINIYGLYPDSCFKVERRKEFSEYSFRYTYLRIINRITKEYLGYTIPAFNIFISGVSHRIASKLKDSGISPEQGLRTSNTDKLTINVIEGELIRCNYKAQCKTYKNIIKYSLDKFS